MAIILMIMMLNVDDPDHNIDKNDNENRDNHDDY